MDWIVPAFWFAFAAGIIICGILKHGKQHQSTQYIHQPQRPTIYKRTKNEKITDDLILFDMVDD